MGKFGFSKWSWKRAIGVTAAKRKFAKATGIPTTKSGRQRKVGRLLGVFALPFLLVFRGKRAKAVTSSPRHEGASASGCLAVSALCGVGGIGIVGVCFVIGVVTSQHQPKQVKSPTKPIIVTKPAAEPIPVVFDSVTQESQERVEAAPDPTPETPEIVTPPQQQAETTQRFAKNDSRRWTSRDGKFATDAELLWKAGDTVTLKKSDGSQIRVSLDRLSDEDNEFVGEWARQRK